MCQGACLLPWGVETQAMAIFCDRLCRTSRLGSARALRFSPENTIFLVEIVNITAQETLYILQCQRDAPLSPGIGEVREEA